MTVSQEKVFNKILSKINQSQLKFMTDFVSVGKSRIGLDLKFEWEDNSIFDYVDAKFDEVRLYIRNYEEKEDNTHELIKPINTLIKQYNSRSIDYFTFIEKYKALNKNLQLANSSKKYSISYRDFSRHYKQSSAMAMKGIGGMGKSHFLWECQQKIQSDNLYKSLFVYGKYFKDVKNIPWDDIIEYSKEKEFLLVIDGINEITDFNDRKYIYDKIKLLQKSRCSRIILSYRTYSLPSLIEGKTEEDYIDELMRNPLNFSGVDFDSAMMDIVANFKVDISYFYHILYSNNAMQLRMLIESKILNNKQLFNKFKDKSVVSITFIYEHFIKSACKRLWGEKNQNVDYWLAVKDVARKLYDSNRIFFTRGDITSKNVNSDKFINDLRNGGYVDTFDNIEYFFKWEQLSNYLIARSFNDDINGKSDDEIAEIFLRKVREFPRLEAFLIAVLVDRYQDNFAKFINFIKLTRFKIQGNEETLLNLIIKNPADRKALQEYIDYYDEYKLFSTFCGIPNRLFNCESFFFEYLGSHHIKIIKPRYTFSKWEVVRKLKGNLHNLNGPYFSGENANEFIKFACLCLLVPDDNIIELAEKTIYDLIELYDYDFSAIIDYAVANFHSPLLKRSIFNIVCHLSRNKRNQYNKFLEVIRDDSEFINAKVITNYCRQFDSEPYRCVSFYKRNLFKEYRNSFKTIKDEFNEFDSFGGVISFIRLNKLYYSLNMELYHNIKLNFELIDLDKEVVLRFNNLSNNIVSQYNNCECNIGIWNSFFDEQLEDIKQQTNLRFHHVNQEDLFWGFVSHLKTTFEFYEVTEEDLNWYKDGKYREHKIFPDNITSLVTICVEEYIGSLMCNYFEAKCDVSYWGNKIYLGYTPIEYLEEQISLYSPIQSFNPVIKTLDNLVIQRLETQFKGNKDKKWADNKISAKANVTAVLEPYKFEKSEWILLSCHITNRTHYHGVKMTSSMIDYSEENIIIYCATNYTKNKTCSLDRHKTIEIDTYKGSVKDYANQRFDFCKKLDTVKGDSSNFKETNLVFPPSKIINFLKLVFDVKRSAWVNEHNEIVMLCNNDSCHSHIDDISSSVYINKKYFDEIKEKLGLYYYAFTERLSYEVGSYSCKSDMHLILKDNNIVKTRMNLDSRRGSNPRFKKKCFNCIIYKNYKKHDEEIKNIKSFDVYDFLDDNLYD